MNQPDERKLNEFIDDICSYIKFREIHEEIVQELRGHLDDLVEAHTAQGLSHSDAVDRALKDMGSSAEIGRGLHRAHRPQTDWLFITMVGIYIGVVLLTMYSIDGSSLGNITLHGWFVRKMVWTVIGLGAAIGVALIDYRRIRPISKYLLLATGGLMVFTLVFGDHMMGQRVISVGPVRMNMMGIAPFLLLIALPAVLARLDVDRRNDFLLLLALFVIPMWIFLKSNVSPSGLEYGVGFLGLMFATPSVRKHRGVVLSAIVLVILSVCLPFTLDLGSERLQAYLHPESYAHTSAYSYVQGRQALTTTGFWGHGLHASLPYLPGIQSGMVFNYFIYAFGWVSGITIVALMIALLARVIWMSRKTRDGYGRTLVITLGTVLGLQFLYPILMAFGIFPMAGVYIPLMGTDGAVSIAQLACLGLILSVHRRRNIVRTVPVLAEASSHVEL